MSTPHSTSAVIITMDCLLWNRNEVGAMRRGPVDSAAGINPAALEVAADVCSIFAYSRWDGLEGTGPNLFHLIRLASWLIPCLSGRWLGRPLLWRRDSLSDASLTLRIPDTVIYRFRLAPQMRLHFGSGGPIHFVTLRYNAPSTWYFTALDGTLKRKTKAAHDAGENLAVEWNETQLMCAGKGDTRTHC
eukprot:5245242-Amphidinium_carterae.1